ncbi:MAG: carotenoid oxygenase family protein [Acidimicrobiales bacterium]|nr:carotenoid oxygenase family protein [Acidimicrobiales bacterium]MCB9394731.1 carotenoid oxygenase family protein [Acidimicrobiaceae bacterium]
MTALDDVTAADAKLPFHLRGNYAPVMEEVEAFDLPVIGSIPPELQGTYIRNGANPKHGPTMHWFAGDGMLHGVRLRDGRAEWYRNRWVRTKALDGVDRMDMSTGTFDLTVGLANTHVYRHGGRIFALEEGSFPNEVTPELDTLGPYDFGGRLHTPFTAHPHTCAETGEMHFFGYELVRPPYVTYHVADAAGNLVHSQPIDVPGPTMVHDFALSRHYAIFLDLPVVFDLELAMTGTMPFVWNEGYGARIGLLHRDRARRGEQPRWFDVDLCYVFHIMNAWESDDGSTVYLDAGRHAAMWRGGPDQFEPSYLHRWAFDLTSGSVSETQLDDVSHAFPRIDDRRTGLSNRFGWAVGPRPGSDPRSMDAPTNVLKYDLATGERTFHDLGATSMSGEPVFVPAADAAAEDEGYLVTFAYDRSTDSSSFVVLDASDMAAAPIARVPLPQRVPHGFHGSWFADS